MQILTLFPMPDSLTAPTEHQSSSGILQPSPTWKIKLLYDGDCPLCMREVRLIQKKDPNQEHVNLVNIASLSYDPAEHGHITYEEAMGRIHGILPNGKILRNVEVFRRVYEEIGLGWVYRATRIRFVERAVNSLYGLWAKWRLTLTGRPPIEVILAERQTSLAQARQSRCRMAEQNLEKQNLATHSVNQN